MYTFKEIEEYLNKNFCDETSSYEKIKFLKFHLKEIVDYYSNSNDDVDLEIFKNIFKYSVKKNIKFAYEISYAGKKLIIKNDYEFFKRFHNDMNHEEINILLNYVKFSKRFINYLLDNKIIHPNYILEIGYNVPEKYLKRRIRTIDWCILSSNENQEFSKEFIDKYKDKLYLSIIINKNKKISKEITDIILEEINK